MTLGEIMKTTKQNLSLDEFAEVCVVFGIAIQTEKVNRDGAARLIKKIEALVKYPAK